MYKNKKISVSMPAYNEELLIEESLNSIPNFVDTIVVVNDGSSDDTLKVVKKCALKDKRIIIINSNKNEGIGSSLLKAHDVGVTNNADILVVVSGDNQMDTSYMPKLLDSIIDDDFDYAKGNRFRHTSDLKKMPIYRIIGNIVVSFLCKVSTGYWDLFDFLNGFTALKTSTYKKLNKKNIGKEYEFELCMLCELNRINAKVRDIDIPAIYKGEGSSIKFFRAVIREIKYLILGFIRRIIKIKQ